MPRKSLLTSLDIGSDKIALHIGEALADGQIRLLGTGVARSRGVEGGQIVDMGLASQSIRDALQRAEERAGCEVYSVLTNVVGTRVEGRNNCGLIILAGYERAITSQDIRRAVGAASSNSIPFHEQVVASYVQSFVVNQQEGVRNPDGMVGTRLGAYCHIVTAPALELENIKRCVRRAGLEVEDWVPDAVASAHAVLTDEERDLGVILIDVGGGSSDMSIILRGTLQFTSRVGVGGRKVTEAVAHEFRTSFENAQALCQRLGCALPNDTRPSRREHIPGVSGRPGQSVSASKVREVVTLGVREVVTAVNERLAESSLVQRAASGIVLCGGLFMMEGAAEIAERVLGVPVRVGTPTRIQANDHGEVSPRHAVGLGLLCYSRKDFNGYESRQSHGKLGRLFERTREWIQETF